jgi:hypothetical protein
MGQAVSFPIDQILDRDELVHGDKVWVLMPILDGVNMLIKQILIKPISTPLGESEI